MTQDDRRALSDERSRGGLGARQQNSPLQQATFASAIVAAEA
jgi:hypothetical protein